MDQDYLGKDTGKLGFGLMRLPKKENGEMDVEQIKQMVDEFMDAGFTYYDTAFVYDDGDSEKVIKEALVDRYPRDSYTLATKLNAWFKAKNEEEAKAQFAKSLERTGAGYFDYYLLHAIQDSNYDLYDKYGIWDFVKEQRDKGLIKNWGFSYHSDPELLDRLLTEHPDCDFIQLQINYADWENPSVTARENYEVALKHGKPVVIMEPVKGGRLAEPPTIVKEIFNEADPDASYASWAIRFAASLDGIITVLSGMSNLEQMEDNLSYMRDFKPLNEEELLIVQNAQKAMNSQESVPCTACGYCLGGCPQEIKIPEIFKALNEELIWDRPDKAQEYYDNATKDGSKASDCLECGQCESACPQQLKVTDWLKESVRHFEK